MFIDTHDDKKKALLIHLDQLSFAKELNSKTTRVFMRGSERDSAHVHDLPFTYGEFVQAVYDAGKMRIATLVRKEENDANQQR